LPGYEQLLKAKLLATLDGRNSLHGLAPLLSAPSFTPPQKASFLPAGCAVSGDRKGALAFGYGGTA
jgi:hypothetical protein